MSKSSQMIWKGLLLEYILSLFVLFYSFVGLAVMPKGYWDPSEADFGVSSTRSPEESYAIEKEILSFIPLGSFAHRKMKEIDSRTFLDRAAGEIISGYPLSVQLRLREAIYRSSWDHYLPQKHFVRAPDHPMAHLYDGISSADRRLVLVEELQRMPLLQKVVRIRFLLVELGIKMFYLDKTDSSYYRHRLEEIEKVSRMVSWIVERELLLQIPIGELYREISEARLSESFRHQMREWVEQTVHVSQGDFGEALLLRQYPSEIIRPYNRQLLSEISYLQITDVKKVSARVREYEDRVKEQIRYEIEKALARGEFKREKLFEKLKEARASGDALASSVLTMLATSTPFSNQFRCQRRFLSNLL